MLPRAIVPFIGFVQTLPSLSIVINFSGEDDRMANCRKLKKAEFGAGFLVRRDKYRDNSSFDGSSESKAVNGDQILFVRQSS